MQDNYTKIKERINQEMLRRKKEDKENKKIIQQVKIIKKLESDLRKAKLKLEKITNGEESKVKEKNKIEDKAQSDD